VKHIHLDTNAYVAFKRGEAEAVEVLRHVRSVGISSIVLGELLSGFAAGNRMADNRKELSNFLSSSRVTVVPVDEATADYYANTYLSLKRKGSPIPTNDMWIAALALQHGATVFSYDRHFQAVDGLLAGCQLSDFLP
jgi:predicted nucleic acid-binding protein